MRLKEILQATAWFAIAKVEVKQGVVFLRGTAVDERAQQWAGELASKTEGVVAVVNLMEIEDPAVWNFRPAQDEFRSLGRELARSLPLVVLALIVLAIAWGLSKAAAYLLRQFFRRRLQAHLLREIVARTGGVLIFLVGLYLVLRVAGMTQLAFTVVGGTGLIGLILGIAFREITENFLASLFLSIQHPFREGDLVAIVGIIGYVQRLTSRSTVLITLDGNDVQIPNATVFKSTICNYTSNPRRREDFLVGVGYDDSIPEAQQQALQVLADHPAVLADPEPLVLVDSLGAATVNLRVYFWLDGSQHSWLKVKSSVIRLVKRALQDAGISLPDESREVIFPKGVEVRVVESTLESISAQSDAPQTSALPSLSPRTSEAVSTKAEAGLENEAAQVQKQGREAWTPDQGENLLGPEIKK
ncbi:Small-conductance mechanosensitive channel [Anatilimnocola aggregata]|uniref:Small-conductance mechanosensitive channel n=2 Tax=Anatilimnocola aggregata TaxID=2528021 RepID=A0A517Y7N3_9BACT|nr:Small-conductance mechanosensitive channel [Anatilimnocola aggregata]